MPRQVLRHHVGPLGGVVARCFDRLRRLRKTVKSAPKTVTIQDSQLSRQSARQDSRARSFDIVLAHSVVSLRAASTACDGCAHLKTVS
jgi:hypothetical protein